jgi:hypothetical protein
MILKSSVAWALVLSIILFGNIIIFGIIKSNFIFVYFLFALFILLFILCLVREMFIDKKDLILAAFIILIIAITISYTTDAIKSDYDKSQQFNIANADLISQINILSKTNSNYLNYISSLQNQITITQANSYKLQAQIDSINSQKLNPPVQILTLPTPGPTPVLVNNSNNARENDD